MAAPAPVLAVPAPTEARDDRDERLLEAARGGDLDAFESLVRRHQRRVYGLAVHAVHDEGLAEEIAQDVFVQLHANLAHIESPRHLAAWLRRVTSHRVIDALRSRRTPVALECVAEPSVDGHAADPLASRLIRRALHRLTPQARLVVVMRYMEDLAPTEIAEALGMSINTVKSHLRRSLALLRARLTESRRS
jgi:RNA polymerase sigma-70 factor (ECF subfamily)